MSNEELLKRGLKEIGVSCSEKQISSFLTLLSELKKWNRAYSLTAIRDDEGIIIKHFLDSLLYLRVLPEDDLFELADVGTGAGFPGIPIKIVRPGIKITLIEPSRKKAAFLRNMIRVLGLEGANIIEQRLEKLDEKYLGKYDAIVSRATFSIPEFRDAACQYLKEGGRLVLSKGQKVSEELQALRDDPEATKSIKTVYKCRLPFINAERNLVVIECK